MKSGTTSVYRDLGVVPGLRLLPKEGGLFSRSQGSFPAGAGTTVEVCSDYSMGHLFPDVPEKVADQLGTNVPLVYLLRDPLDRLESHLRHLSSLGEPVDVARLDESSHPVLTSSYGYQARRWIDAGHTGLRVVDFHAYSADRSAGLEQVAGILGVQHPHSLRAPDARPENQSKDLRSARAGVRGLVRSSAYQRLRPFIPGTVRARLKNSPLTQGADLESALPGQVRGRLREIFAADLRELSRLVPDAPLWVHEGGRQ
jgi:hypothetical protein